jgi:type II secretory pathway component PulC
MRALALLLLVACGPKVETTPVKYDEDLGDKRQAPAAAAAETPPERPVAPPGKGLRSGTIDRAKLVAVLDQGPGAVLRQVEISARKDGDRFVGWQLVQVLDKGGILTDVDVVPGDVLLAINGKPLSRPDQLQAIWDSLRTANQIKAELWRGNGKLQLEFAIAPPVAAK